MQRQWIGKNIDLALLSKYIEDFLKDNGFKTRKNELLREFKIFGTLRHSRNLRLEVTTRILGSSNDFVIEFLAGKPLRRSIMLGYITTMMGGGIFLLRDLKSKELLERIEREFWMYIEEAVTRLVGSAESSYAR